MIEFAGWMKQAVDERIISESEAREIQAICLKADTEFVAMPKHLSPACERILLWEVEIDPILH